MKGKFEEKRILVRSGVRRVGDPADLYQAGTVACPTFSKGSATPPTSIRQAQWPALRLRKINSLFDDVSRQIRYLP